MSALILRARTFRDWLTANFDKGQLRDLANHGADTGWHGLSYNADGAKLFDKYATEIWNVLATMADDMGYDNVPALMLTFQRADMLGSLDGMKMLAVWAVAEHYARDLTGEE